MVTSESKRPLSSVLNVVKEEKEMDAKRHIGTDLHRDYFTACMRLETDGSI